MTMVILLFSLQIPFCFYLFTTSFSVESWLYCKWGLYLHILYDLICAEKVETGIIPHHLWADIYDIIPTGTRMWRSWPANILVHVTKSNQLCCFRVRTLVSDSGSMFIDDLLVKVCGQAAKFRTHHVCKVGIYYGTYNLKRQEGKQTYSQRVAWCAPHSKMTFWNN